MNGTIKTLTDRGFGFIAREGEKRDLFFHSKELVGVTFDELKVGDLITFEIQSVSRKPVPDLRTRHDLFLTPYNEVTIPSPTSDEEVELQRRVNAQFIASLSRSPHDLYRLSPQEFEEVIAELFVLDGYKAELLGSVNKADGGVDIIVVKSMLGIELRMAIQCKRYLKKLVSAQPIRSLSGVLDRFGAHAGVISTTSDFTKPARMEASRYFPRISLMNYQDIVDQLAKAELLQRTTAFSRNASSTNHAGHSRETARNATAFTVPTGRQAESEVALRQSTAIQDIYAAINIARL